MISRNTVLTLSIAAVTAVLGDFAAGGGFVGIQMFGTAIYSHPQGTPFAPVELVSVGVAAALILLSAVTFFVPMIVVGLRLRTGGACTRTPAAA